MKTFHQLLANNLLATVANNFQWFAVIYWLYLETESVLGTSLVGGLYLGLTALSGFWLGSIVDHNKKKYVMLLSSLTTLTFLCAALLVFLFTPAGAFTSLASVSLWVMIILMLFGAIAGNLRTIALPTVTTILVPEGERDKANGLAGTFFGISFMVATAASGLLLGLTGMFWTQIAAISITVICIVHLLSIHIPEKDIVHTEDAPRTVDIKGTIKIVRGVPGLFALLFFNTFNNFLGGVYMALMDAYGLTMVTVEVWGILWAVLGFGFIAGGMYIAKMGLGKHPLRALFIADIFMWTVSMLFAVQPWIVLLSIGVFFWMFLSPFIEAAEQTIIQKVVPPGRQGRVFGFAQSIEQAASPLTAFLIGPIAQFIFIPFMTTGAGVGLIGGWFGTGIGRGIALVFILAGLIGLIVTLIAFHSRSYKLLSAQYTKPAASL